MLQQIASGKVPRLCVDRRTIDPHATGVAEYGRVLRGCLSDAGHAALVLDEGDPNARGAALRRLAAAVPGRRRLHESADGFHRLDVFREAQVRFRIHGCLLTLTAPGPPGVMHWGYPLPMRIAGWRNIYTIHDVIPFDPDLASPVDANRLQLLTRQLCRTADRLVTVSRAAQRSIADALQCPGELLTNMSQAVDVAEGATGPLPFGLTAGGFFLFVGAIERRKNLERLIQAHARSGASRPLILLGPDGGASAEVARLACILPNVVRLPFQPRAVVLQLMANAVAVLLPSLAEGFGLPVAEAMALGTPVMTSNAGALKEIAGGAALLVDPLDLDAMAGAIANLDQVPELREQLKDAGLRRATAFSPAAYADRLLGLYRDVWHG